MPLTNNVDSIAHRGVSTGVMLTNVMRELANYPEGVALYMNAVSDRTAQFNTHTVHSYDADYVYKLLRKPNLSEIRGIHFIQAPDLSTADRVVGDLTATLGPLLNDRQTSAAAVGVLLTGEGDWSQVVKIPVLFRSGLVKTPRQSYEIGVDGTPSLGGLMCLAGKGVVRKDSRERLAHCDGPGDGCLRLDQIVFEMLSKTELILKFGA